METPSPDDPKDPAAFPLATSVLITTGVLVLTLATLHFITAGRGVDNYAIGPLDAVAAPTSKTPTQALGTPTAAGSTAEPTKADLRRWKTAYNTACNVCHQPTGTGLPNLYPPVTRSAIAQGDPERIIAIALKGLKGPMVVNGQPFGTNSAFTMTPLESLDDATLAAAISHVRAAADFGNQATPVTADQVKAVREKLQSRKTQWTEADLRAAYPWQP